MLAGADPSPTRPLTWMLGLFVLLSTVGSVRATPVTLYELTRIPSLPSGNAMYVSGINNAGVAVGTQYIQTTIDANTTVNTPHAFLFDGNATTSLDSLNNASSAAGINDLGQVVGRSSNGGFMFNGTLHDLGAPANSSFSAINNDGQIALNVQNSGLHRAYFYDGAFHDLGTLTPSDNEVVANDINASGHIVGSSSTYAGGASSNATGQAIFYDGALHGLGTLPGFAQAQAMAINDSDQIVGFAFNPLSGDPQTYRAFLYDGEMHDLGLPGIQSFAEDINAAGDVVGEYFDANSWHPFLYKDGVITNLNDYLATSGFGWRIEFATGINDLGQIAVYGSLAGVGQVGAILTPCAGACVGRSDGPPANIPMPEPSSLLLFGIGLLGEAARRGFRTRRLG